MVCLSHSCVEVWDDTEEEFNIFINLLDGLHIQVAVYPQTSILQVMEIACRATRIAIPSTTLAHFMIVLFNGRQVGNLDSVAQHGVQAGSAIRITTRLVG